MMSSINLLKRAQTPEIARKRVRRTLNIVSMVSIIAFTIISASLFLLNYFLVVKIKEVNQGIRLSEIKINALAEDEVIQLAISDKLTALEKILANDTKFDETLRKFKEILPAGITISQVLLGERTFSVSLTSAKLSSLNQLIGNLILPEEEKKHFTKIVLENLTFDEKGMYRMNISGEAHE